MEGKSEVRSTWLGGGWLFMARPWSAGSMFFLVEGQRMGDAAGVLKVQNRNFQTAPFFSVGFPPFTGYEYSVPAGLCATH